MMKVGLNNDELQQLVKDLKAGKSWPDVVTDRLSLVDPKALAASDYKEWAHRTAGLPLPDEGKPAAPPPPPPEETAEEAALPEDGAEEGEDALELDDGTPDSPARRGGRGKRRK